MATIRNRLFPFHDVSEHDKVNLYALDGLGDAGQLVKISTGTANPQSTEVDGYSSTAVGTTYNGTYSNRYLVNWRVTPTASGDTRFVALGLTEYSTKETDENGFPLKYFDNRAKEIGAVRSGEATPIITRGLVGIWGKYIDQSLGAVQPGHLAVVSRSGDGTIASIAPTHAMFSASGVIAPGVLYTPNSVVGKWLSSLPTSSNTGIANEFSAQGGYAFLQLDCAA